MKEKQNYEAPQMKVYLTRLNHVLASSPNGATEAIEEGYSYGESDFE